MILNSLRRREGRRCRAGRIKRRRRTIRNVKGVPHRQEDRRYARSSNARVSGLRRGNNLDAGRVLPHLNAMIEPTRRDNRNGRRRNSNRGALTGITPKRCNIRNATRRDNINRSLNGGANLNVRRAKNRRRRDNRNTRRRNINRRLRSAPRALLSELFRVEVKIRRREKTRTNLIKRRASLGTLLNHRRSNATGDATRRNLQLRDVSRSNLRYQRSNVMISASSRRTAHRGRRRRRKRSLLNRDNGPLRTARDSRDHRRRSGDARGSVMRQRTIGRLSKKRHPRVGNNKCINRSLIRLTRTTSARKNRRNRSTRRGNRRLAGPLTILLNARTILRVMRNATKPLTLFITTARVRARRVLEVINRRTRRNNGPRPRRHTNATRTSNNNRTNSITNTRNDNRNNARHLRKERNALLLNISGSLLFRRTASNLLPPIASVKGLRRLNRRDNRGANTRRRGRTQPTPRGTISTIIGFNCFFSGARGVAPLCFCRWGVPRQGNSSGTFCGSCRLWGFILLRKESAGATLRLQRPLS